MKLSALFSATSLLRVLRYASQVVSCKNKAPLVEGHKGGKVGNSLHASGHTIISRREEKNVPLFLI